MAGLEGNCASAGAALKAIMAEKLAECAIRAMRLAKSRRIKFGAAAVILAAQEL